MNWTCSPLTSSPLCIGCVEAVDSVLEEGFAAMLSWISLALWWWVSSGPAGMIAMVKGWFEEVD